MIKSIEENWGLFLLIIITIFSIVIIIKHLKVKPTPSNQQGGDTQKDDDKKNVVEEKKKITTEKEKVVRTTEKFSWWKFVIGLGIIIFVLGLFMRMNTPYSEKVTIKKGSDYTFDVYNERIVINPQVHCIHVIYPDYAEYTFCPDVPVNVGEHGVGLYRLQATSDSQFVIISREPLTISKKFVFWINPFHLKYLFD